VNARIGFCSMNAEHYECSRSEFVCVECLIDELFNTN